MTVGKGPDPIGFQRKALRRSFPLGITIVSGTTDGDWSMAKAADVNTNSNASVPTLNNYLRTSSSTPL
jgi:hypothetical protein